MFVSLDYQGQIFLPTDGINIDLVFYTSSEVDMH